MKNTLKMEMIVPMVLEAETAAELMTPNPVSVRDIATVRDGVKLLIDKGISAAPVIDNAGRPVGVLSRTDILIHNREKVEYLEPMPEYFSKEELHTGWEDLSTGFQVEKVDKTRVHELMTPVVFSVRPDTPARKVVEEMVALKVHRLFVVDSGGVLVGVISALDVLRFLHSGR